MLKKYTNWMTVVLLTAVIAGISACSAATPAVPTQNPDSLVTQAAQTVAAQFTQTAAAAPQATSTTEPTITPVPPTPTTAVEQPTQPPAATNTPPAPAKPNQPAVTDDNASFVADVTVPDGTGAVAGSVFPKTWRIKNTGKTTWTAAYTLVFIDGERMNAPDKIDMPKEVRPGETVDLTVNLTAPTKAGSYQAFYRLRNASGQYFRLDGSGDLWVKIAVGSGATATLVPSVTPGGDIATPAATKQP